MRGAVLVLVVSLMGCHSMGDVGAGLGHVANAAGHVASAAGHVAGAAGQVASVAGEAVAPVARGVVNAAAPIATKALKAAPTATNIALETAAAMSAGPPPGIPPSLIEHTELRQDLCLDCPDAGNCASCPVDRHQTF